MYAYILFFLFLSVIIFCVVGIIRGKYADPLWYRIGIGLFGSILFVFIMVEAITYMNHRADIYAIKNYSSVLRALKEKSKANETLLTFVLSKQKKKIKVNELKEVKSIDDFFSNNPEVKRNELEKLLTEYLEIKQSGHELEQKLAERGKNKIRRENNRWTLILPKGAIMIRYGT